MVTLEKLCHYHLPIQLEYTRFSPIFEVRLRLLNMLFYKRIK